MSAFLVFPVILLLLLVFICICLAAFTTVCNCCWIGGTAIRNRRQQKQKTVNTPRLPVRMAPSRARMNSEPIYEETGYYHRETIHSFV